jgi:hypothetical protein
VDTCDNRHTTYCLFVTIVGSASGEDATLLRETGKELATDSVLTSDEALLCS